MLVYTGTAKALAFNDIFKTLFYDSAKIQWYNDVDNTLHLNVKGITLAREY